MAKANFETNEHPYGEAFGSLINEFARLPGIGRKSAERLAYHILNCREDDAMALSDSIRQVRTTIQRCKICQCFTQTELCSICSDPRRDQSVVCIVEQPKDMSSLEASGAFHGLYHVLHGHLAPLDGIGPDDLTIDELMKRIRKGEVKELVMATNPTLEGDGTALYITNLIHGSGIKITRLARGIASGSVLEFANREMLADALRGRQAF